MRARRTDKLVGTPLLTDLQPRSDRDWHGKLFIPDKNMRVDRQDPAASASTAEGLRLRDGQSAVQIGSCGPRADRAAARDGLAAASSSPRKLKAPFLPQRSARAAT